MTVNTAKVTGRRQLRFNSLDDLRAELDRLDGAEVQTIGNWNLGQILKHLAIGLDIPVKGAAGFKIPWYYKLMAPFMKNKMINNPALINTAMRMVSRRVILSPSY